MIDAVLTKAGSFRTAAIPGKVFAFEQAVEVTQEEMAILEECGWFKFVVDSTADVASEVTLVVAEAGETIVKPAGGVVIRKKALKVEDLGVTV